MRVTSPFDHPVDLPTLGLAVPAGGTVTVPAAVGSQLLAQGWTKATEPSNPRARRSRRADPVQED